MQAIFTDYDCKIHIVNILSCCDGGATIATTGTNFRVWTDVFRSKATPGSLEARASYWIPENDTSKTSFLTSKRPSKLESPKLGCVSLVVRYDGRIAAIKCAKGRGVILPGGKVEPGETFRVAAARELKEETNLVASKQRFVFSGLNTDGYYVYVFATEVLNTDDAKSSTEGQFVWAAWEDLLESEFATFYDLLKTVLESK